MNQKIDLKKIKKDKIKISKDDREALSSKGKELSNKSELQSENLNKLISSLEEKDRFIKEGARQQSSINTSDYTNCLIDILVEAKKEKDGEKIRKTSYLERFIINGVKEELKNLGIKIN